MDSTLVPQSRRTPSQSTRIFVSVIRKTGSSLYNATCPARCNCPQHIWASKGRGEFRNSCPILFRSGHRIPAQAVPSDLLTSPRMAIRPAKLAKFSYADGCVMVLRPPCSTLFRNPSMMIRPWEARELLPPHKSRSRVRLVPLPWCWVEQATAPARTPLPSRRTGLI